MIFHNFTIDYTYIIGQFHPNVNRSTRHNIYNIAVCTPYPTRLSVLKHNYILGTMTNFHDLSHFLLLFSLRGGGIITRLQELRKERGYTQIKMQHLTGIDQSDYSKLERGKRYFTFEQCRRIALALNTSMDYLAGLTDIKEPYSRK